MARKWPAPPPADDRKRKWIETGAQIILRTAAYIVITHWRHWGL